MMLERGESEGLVRIARDLVEAIVGRRRRWSRFVWRELRDRATRSSTSAMLRTGSSPAAWPSPWSSGFALYASVFVLPVFLQNLHGFTAWETGKVILPGAIASGVHDGVDGPARRTRFDARVLITIGVLLFLWSMWLHSHFTLDERACTISSGR